MAPPTLPPRARLAARSARPALYVFLSLHHSTSNIALSNSHKHCLTCIILGSQISCGEGFLSNSAAYTCGADGQWALNEGQTAVESCTPITCPAKNGPTGTTTTCAADSAIGATCSVCVSIMMHSATSLPSHTNVHNPQCQRAPYSTCRSLAAPATSLTRRLTRAAPTASGL
jgi:hypothetical protein